MSICPLNWYDGKRFLFEWGTQDFSSNSINKYVILDKSLSLFFYMVTAVHKMETLHLFIFRKPPFGQEINHILEDTEILQRYYYKVKILFSCMVYSNWRSHHGIDSFLICKSSCLELNSLRRSCYLVLEYLWPN